MHPEIQAVAAAIGELCSPKRIYLVSRKENTAGELVSFKLALVVSDRVESISEQECALYAQVDCDYPFDLVLYRESEWNTLCADQRTFAWKIAQNGSVLG